MQHPSAIPAYLIPPFQTGAEFCGLHHAVSFEPHYNDDHFAVIRTYNAPVTMLSLHGYNFKKEKVTWDAEQKSSGRHTYYRHIGGTDYSVLYRHAVNDAVCGFADKIRPKRNWEQWPIEQRSRYLQKTNVRFWSYIDPDCKLTRAAHVDFKTGVTAPCIKPIANRIYFDFMKYMFTQNFDHLKQASGTEAAEFIANVFSDLCRKQDTHGYYKGGYDDVVALNVCMRAPLRAGKGQNDVIAELIQDKFDLRDTVGETPLDDCVTLSREDDLYVLRYRTPGRFINVMKVFFHEQTHRIQNLTALHYERTGQSPLPMLHRDYELTKLSKVHYVQPEDNYELYRANLLEVHAREVQTQARRVMCYNGVG